MSTQREVKLPEVGELVIGTVARVDRHGALVTLDEYDGLEAFVHISEVSLKWVRNIRDYLREGQKTVLKVIRSSPETMQVDVSLRRVSQRERNEKMLRWNQLVKVRRMLSMLTEKTGIGGSALEEGLLRPAQERHIDVYRLLEEVASGDPLPSWVELPEDVKEALVEMCKHEIKRSVAVAKRVVKLYSRRGGVSKVRLAAEEAMKLGNKGERVVLTVIGAPRYLLRVEAESHERAEELIREALEVMRAKMDGEGGTVEILEGDTKKK